MAKELSSGIVLFYKENNHIEYLLLKHSQGHWAFPKGHVESEESLQETALRETKEETGLEIDLNDKFRKQITYFFKSKDVIISKDVIFFLAQSKNMKVILSEEHTDFKWLPFSKALRLLKYKTQKETLKKANNYLKNEK